MAHHAAHSGNLGQTFDQFADARLQPSLPDDANLQAEVLRQSLEPLARQGGQVVVTKLVNLWREFASWSLQAACRSRRDRYTLPSTRQPSQFGCQRTIDAGKLKRFEYLIVGDASSVEGLGAPYDEEETTQVVHVEILEDLDLFDFWLAHQKNSDQFSARRPEPRAFSK